MSRTKYYFMTMVVLASLAASCSSDSQTAEPTLSPDGTKTPLEVSVSLPEATASVTTKSATRAVNGSFEASDELIAKICHVKKGDNDSYSEVDATNLSKIVTFKVNANADGTTTNLTSSINGTPTTLYWDDFSNPENSTADSYGDNDIRATGHGLRTEWGWCYNGGTAPSSNDENVTWEVSDDQNTNGIKKYDLLWSKTQNPVEYKHNPAERKGLEIPYSHALSKMTVVITADESYTSSPFDNTSVTLNSAYTKGTFKASDGSVSGQSDTYKKEITMNKSNTTDSPHFSATFECLFIPGTKFTDVTENFVTITNVDGYTYKIKAEEENILKKWFTTESSPYTSKSGENYQLKVKVAKQKIDVTATIADWTPKTTEEIQAPIAFSTDLKNVTLEGSAIDVTNASFRLYRKSESDSEYTQATICTYNASSDSKWTCNTPIYWENGSTGYYFRGLAIYKDDKLTSENADTSVSQDTDLLWATTPKHKGQNNNSIDIEISEGAKIDPRTSAVPLEFRHAMSKVKFSLETSGDEASKVDLTDATITISDVANSGTLNMHSGVINASSDSKQNISGLTSGTEKIVIPQSLSDKKLTVRLSDGTTYSLNLTDCTLNGGNNTKIEKWEGGNSYQYTIKLQKEAVQFWGLIKDWNKKEGGGDASLDWDDEESTTNE